MSGPGRPTFSVIVPSVGRPSLERTLASVACQVEPGDEIIVVVDDDGDDYFAKETAELLGTEPVWCDVVVGLARPESNLWRRFRYWLAPRYRLGRLGSSRPRPEWSG